MLFRSSWRMAMVPWIVIAGLTAIYWYSKKEKNPKPDIFTPKPFWKTSAFRNPIAWAMVFYFGLQSFSYYSTATWLPTILTTKGLSLGHAALMVSVTGIIGSAIGIAAPHYIGRYSDKRKILVINSAFIVLGFVMVTIQTGPILLIWLLISNIGMSIKIGRAHV